MTRRWALAFTSLALVFLTACPQENGSFGPKGRSAFVRYVSIGTSISEGWQSDGVVYTSQVNSWPALLARVVDGVHPHAGLLRQRLQQFPALLAEHAGAHVAIGRVEALVRDPQ